MCQSFLSEGREREMGGTEGARERGSEEIKEERKSGGKREAVQLC